MPVGEEPIDFGSADQCQRLNARFTQVWIYDPEVQNTHCMAHAEDVFNTQGMSGKDRERMQCIFQKLQLHLEHQNPLCQEYKNMRQQAKSLGQPLHCFDLVLRNGMNSAGQRDQCFVQPSSTEVASIVVGQGKERDVLVQLKEGNKFVQVPEYSQAFDPLHFVLLHP